MKRTEYAVTMILAAVLGALWLAAILRSEPTPTRRIETPSGYEYVVSFSPDRTERQFDAPNKGYILARPAKMDSRPISKETPTPIPIEGTPEP